MKVLELAWYLMFKFLVKVEILILKIYMRLHFWMRLLHILLGRIDIRRMAIQAIHAVDLVGIAKVRLSYTSIVVRKIWSSVSDWILLIIIHVRIALFSSCIVRLKLFSHRFSNYFIHSSFFHFLLSDENSVLRFHFFWLYGRRVTI